MAWAGKKVGREEGGPVEGDAEEFGLGVLVFRFIEELEVKQVRQLLDVGDGIGEPARPHDVGDLVELGADFGIHLGGKDGGIEVINELADAGTEEGLGLLGRVGVNEGRFEKVTEFHATIGHPAPLEHGEKFGLFHGKLVGNQPGAEVFLDCFLAGFDRGQAEGGPDEVDDGADRRAVSVAKGLFIKIEFVGVQLLNEVVFFAFSQCLAFLDLDDDRIVGLGVTNRLFPAGTVFVFVDAPFLRSHLDVGDALAPTVLKVKLGEFATSAPGCPGRLPPEIPLPAKG